MERKLILRKEQQEKLHPLVKAIHLATASMTSMSPEAKADLLMEVEDLPQNLQELPWVKKVHSAREALKKGEDQTNVLKNLFKEGKQEHILPEGYLI